MSIFTIYLIFSMLAVLWFDVTRYIIPNWLTGSLLVLYPLAVWMAPVPADWKMGLAAMGIVFAVGYIVFAMKWMGGGDIKLITVCALWVGLANLADFTIAFALLGGVFSLVVWGARKVLPLIPKQLPKLPRILREGEPIPYGVAISLAFLWMMWSAKVPMVMLP